VVPDEEIPASNATHAAGAGWVDIDEDGMWGVLCADVPDDPAISRDVVDACVVSGRYELPRLTGVHHVGSSARKLGMPATSCSRSYPSPPFG